MSYLPFAFTEHGVTMLAGVLRSERAIQMNVAIVRAFVVLREMAMNYKELAQKVKEMENMQDRQFADIYQALKVLIEEKESPEKVENRERIGFKTTESKL